MDKMTSCASVQYFEVNAYEKPLAGFEWMPVKPVELRDEVELYNTSLGAEQSSWTWYFANDIKFTVEKQNASYLFKEAGKYPVVMVVENKWGCSDTTINVIEVLPDFAFYMPNAFTPNADSKNETLKPTMRGTDEKNYYFQVFNRWGERLFVTRNPLEGWDGTYKDEPCKQENYVWVIEVSSGGEGKKYSGTVLLYR
jgi:gliding motility-associated-like protein